VDGRLEVQRRRLRDRQLKGLYTEYPRPSGLALNDSLSYEEQEALEVESEILLETGRAARWGGREFFFDAQSYEMMSRRRINSLRKTIERKRPEWVEAIKEAARATNNIYLIVDLAGLGKYPYPAVAIIENLRDRGELQVSSDLED
jgi:hypothetical protein